MDKSHNTFNKIIHYWQIRLVDIIELAIFTIKVKNYRKMQYFEKKHLQMFWYIAERQSIMLSKVTCINALV